MEMSFEIIPNGIIPFISAQFTQIPGILIVTRNDVLNLLWRTTTPIAEVEIEPCPCRLSARFPVLK